MWIQLDDWLVVLIGLKLAFAVSNFDDDILASEGSTVIVKCPENSTDALGWGYSVFSETQIPRMNFSPIADGSVVDPTFRNRFRLHLKKDVETGNYDLQISNVTIDDDGVYRCSYVKENKTGQKDIHLRLEKAPKNIRFITNENLSVIEGTKGQNITLSCVVDSGIPRETLRINRNDSEVARGDHGSLNYTFLLQKSDHMSEFICTAMSSILTSQLITSIRIHVNYPPVLNVIIGNKKVGRRILICHAYGVPALYIYSKWEHMSSFGEHIRFLDGFDNGTLILPYMNESDGYQDNGIYLCTVNNGVPDVKGRINQTGDILLNVEADSEEQLKRVEKSNVLMLLQEEMDLDYRPRFSIKNKEVQYGKYGESTKLEFYIYSFGANVNGVSLKSQEGTLCPIKSLTITTEKIMIMYFKKFIHVNGSRITFDTKILIDLDFRKYKIIVENNYGEGVFDFTLQSASLPQLPYNITVTSSPTSLTVYWSSGFNGGFEQSFYIEICQDNDGNCTEYGPFNDSPVKYQSGQIGNLQPGNVYLIRMYANNSVGYSNMTDEVIVRTRDLYMSYSKHVIVGVVAVAVSILCASVTVSIYRKWLKKRKDRTGNMNIIDVNEANQGVIPIENVLYQSHNLPQISDRRTCVTYCPTGGSSNAMDGPVVASYSVAESENDQEVFNDYLVEDIDRQENVSRDLQRQRGTPIKNNDLNYSELAFSPSASSRFIIHGLENKTIYSEFDLPIRVSTLQSSVEGNNVDSDDDDDFMSVEDIQKYIKREERNC